MCIRDRDDIDSISQKQIKSKSLLDLIQNTTISSSLKNRKSKGSSGTSEQIRMISHRSKKILLYKKTVRKQNTDVKKAFDALTKHVKTLTK